jgi:hypothetical protein
MKSVEIDEAELKEYVKEENKPLVELDQSKCNKGWYLFPSSSDLFILAFACK